MKRHHRVMVVGLLVGAALEVAVVAAVVLMAGVAAVTFLWLSAHTDDAKRRQLWTPLALVAVAASFAVGFAEAARPPVARTVWIAGAAPALTLVGLATIGGVRPGVGETWWSVLVPGASLLLPPALLAVALLMS